ncbi:MAG: ABC transporter permease subunit [Oscillospiraceae bacterium]|nr:ABC transporter permease subunit [Oscillospiraceae bacterium]
MSSSTHPSMPLKQKKPLAYYLKRDWRLLVIISLPFTYYIIFNYAPMFGLIMAFQNFKAGRGFLGSEFVGLKYFLQFFQSIYFPRLVRNTLLLNVYGLLFSFPIPIIFALLLNNIMNIRVKNTIQTIVYFPHFLSSVIVVGMVVNMFSVNGGVINIILKQLGMATHSFLSDPGSFRPLYVGSEIWQRFGFSSIIYLAAIMSIPQEMYEAAVIDGATRFQMMLRITLPSILPTITICLLLQLGGMMSVGFEKVFLLYNESTYETADVISTYVYRRGLANAEYSFGAAVGFFNSVVNFSLLIIFNTIARRVGETSLW